MRTHAAILRRSFLLLLFAATSAFSQPSGPNAVAFDPDVSLSDQSFAHGVTGREPSIAASLTNPLNLVVAFKDHYPSHSDFACRSGRTVNGGVSWILDGQPPSAFLFHSCTDPVIVADAGGNFYFVYMDSELDQNNTILRTNINAAKSTDGGATFSTFSAAVLGDPSRNIGPDKPYAAIDTFPRSKFKGRIYVSYGGDFSNGTYRIQVVVSSDGGRTWTTPVIVSDEASLLSNRVILGSVPLVAPDGTVYIFWVDGFDPVGPSRIAYTRSKDGGRTWSAPSAVAGGFPNAVDFLIRNEDSHFAIQPDIGALANSFPTAAVTPDGRIFVAWADASSGGCVDIGGFRSSCSNIDVRLSSSTDGRTWSAPRKISDDVGSADQMFPWIATHPNGLLSLMWMDKRLDPLNANYDVFYTNTADGVAFLPNVRVTTATSRVGGGFDNYGDYNNLAATAGAVIPVWTDARTANDLDVFVARGVLLP